MCGRLQLAPNRVSVETGPIAARILSPPAPAHSALGAAGAIQPRKVYTATRGRGAAGRKRLSYQLPYPPRQKGDLGDCCRPSMPTRYLARIPTWSGGSGAPKVLRILWISLVKLLQRVRRLPQHHPCRVTAGIDHWPGPHRHPVRCEEKDVVRHQALDRADLDTQKGRRGQTFPVCPQKRRPSGVRAALAP
jgi:hypothetical protein